MDSGPQHCGEELGYENGYYKCARPAEFIIWGKLFPKEALGPRCYDCAAKHVGHQALSDSSYAIYHLPDIKGMRAEIEHWKSEADFAQTLSSALADEDLAQEFSDMRKTLDGARAQRDSAWEIIRDLQAKVGDLQEHIEFIITGE